MNKSVLMALFAIIGLLQAESNQARATFAGGCYWCMEEAMEKIQGVTSVTSGFEGDVEAVDILFDPARITYEELLEAYWKNIDPLDEGGQFCDRGAKYRSAIFYHDEIQRRAAIQSKNRIENRLKQPVATAINEADMFSVAPEEDQDYYKNQPDRYHQYKTKCRRSERLRELWGAQ